MSKTINFKLAILTCFLQNVTFAQEEKESNVSFSGSVDVYATTNLADNARGSIGILAANTSGEPAHGFGLGMANTVISYDIGKAGAVADLAFGPRASAANAYEGNINQLYVYYRATDKLVLSLGQFNTFFGYEVISPVDNFNYSVSYLFNAGPFSHTGVKADYQVSDDLSFMLAVTNPHGLTAGTNITNDFQVGFQTGYKGQFFNVVYGADGFGFDDVLYLDYTGGFNATDSFYVGINAAYSNSNDADGVYYGGALYLQNTFSNTFALGVRPEYFTTTSGGTDQSVLALTLSANKELTKNLKVIGEVRFDTSNDIPVIGTKDNVTGVTFAAIYKFN